MRIRNAFFGYSDIYSHLKADHSGEGRIVPTWTAVDTNNVKTSRELWESMKSNGWRVDVSILETQIMM